MADYRGIKGFNIQSLASDPSANTNTEGQVWYNTSGKVLKGVAKVAGVGSWASGGALNTARRSMSGTGSQTAALIVGGQPPPSAGLAITETYNGTAWTEVADLNSARTGVGQNQVGTSTAAQIQGGASPSFVDICEQYNGTSWTETADLLANRGYAVGAGTTTAALAYGGSVNQPTDTAAVESWNGTSWSETTDINTARRYVTGGGPQTAAILFAGAPYVALTETWNGTAWTEVADLNTARQDGSGITGSSATTSALMVGGFENVPVASTVTAKVEQGNGTSWSEQADIATARGQAGGNGAATTTAGLIAGGHPPGTGQALCEEWTVAAATYGVKTFTSS